MTARHYGERPSADICRGWRSEGNGTVTGDAVAFAEEVPPSLPLLYPTWWGMGQPKSQR